MSTLNPNSKSSDLYLQLYSLRHETSLDPEATLRAVPELGFSGIELAGDYGWPVEHWRALLGETGLSVLSSHQGLESLENHFDGCTAFHRALGAKHLVVPGLNASEHQSATGFREAAHRLNALGRKLSEEGFTLSYHNHDFEFAPLASGSLAERNCGMDILLAETEPTLVHFEVDTFWVEHTGRNAAEFIRRHAARISLIHAKDLRRRDRQNVPAGQGDVDFGALLPLCSANDWPLIVEFEGRDALEAVRQSAVYLHGLPQ